MLQGFHHIAINCADIDKSIAFYTAIGGTVYRTWGEGKSRACMIGFGKENYLELFANGAPGRPADQNVVHFAFRSTDTAADFAKAIAAGAVEGIFCVLSVYNNIVPPTINHEEGDDDPELDYKMNFTFNKPQKREVRAALSNTFGFGGHNACVIFKKYAE